MRTQNPWIAVLTLGLVGASLPLAAGCSSETPGSTTGGTGGTAGAAAGATSNGGSAAGVAGTGGAAGQSSGGAAGSAGSGGPAGMGGSGALGGGGASAGTGAGNGGAGTGGGGMGGAGDAGAPTAGAGSGGMAGGAGGGAGGAGGSGAFTLTSPDHMEGAAFADPYTCAEAGFNGSILPELHWTAGPAGTMSYAITFIDVTLADQGQANGYHWVIWNIPANVLTLPEGFTDQASIGAQENRDFLGPCPNFGGGGANTDTYEFTIYALSQASINITGSGTTAVQNAETMLEANNLASAKLTGTSNASPP